MADLEHFDFLVPGYTPETMPLDRLIEYLNQLAIVLGEPKDLHLIRIEKSSTRPVLAMRHDVAVRARARASEVRQGGGSTRRREAFNAIRKMVSEDGGKPAVLKAKEGKILEFTKVELGEDQIVHAVRQHTTVQGTLARIGGTGDYAQLLIQELSGGVIAGCFSSKSVAQGMAHLLYKPVRVSGIGSWHRTAEGQWQINRLHVQSFDPLDDDDLEDVVAKLRAIRHEWPEDGIAKLLAMRGNDA